MTLTDAIRQYLNAMYAMGRSPHTVKGAKSALKELHHFLQHLDVDQIEHLDHDTLMHYREELAWRLTPSSAQSSRVSGAPACVLPLVGGERFTGR